MLLAAGRGERMEPLSSWIPKPALEVLGHPLLASSLQLLGASGCRTVVINLHRHPEDVAAAVRSARPPGVDPIFSWEPELLGSAGGISAARPLLGDGPVLAANADIYTELDLSPVLEGDEDEIVLAVLPHPDPTRWSSLTLDPRGRVTAVVVPGRAGGQERFLFTGWQRVGAVVLRSLPSPPAEIGRVWDELRRRGALRAAVVAGRWREAGTPAGYRDLVVELLGERSWIHPAATVDPSAVLDTSAVGAACTVGGGARLAGSVITAGASLGPGTRLERCVAAGPVRVPVGTTLADALLLPGGVYPLHAS
ncbi:MAG: sugar phosphate nucleotidyltransferase [Acidobacteriota bacterium]